MIHSSTVLGNVILGCIYYDHNNVNILHLYLAWYFSMIKGQDYIYVSLSLFKKKNDELSSYFLGSPTFI